MFKDDRHILAFLANLGAFEDQIVDEDDREEGFNEEDNDPILNLPSNIIPKGMVTLEHLFNLDPRVKEKLTIESEVDKYEPHNIDLEG